MRARSTCLVFAIAACSVVLLRCGSSADIPALMATDMDGGSEAATPPGEAPPTDTGDASNDGAPTTDAPGGSGGITTDGGPGGTTTSIACGSTACALPAQSCCIDRLGGGAASYACVTGSTCPAGNGGGNQDPPTALQCAGAANCGPGTVCCVSRTGDAISSVCKASCSGKDTAQLCDKTAATTGCPVDAGTLSNCSSKDIGDWGLPSTFATCGGRGN